MEVSCPNCYATYDVPPEKIPVEGVKPTCKKCGVPFTIVKATGDPLEDRAKRKQGFVLVYEGRKEDPSLRADSSRSGAHAKKESESKALYKSKPFIIGIAVAGIVVVLLLAGFYLWRNSIHNQLERAFRNSLARAATNRFALNYQGMNFSILGGLSRHEGRIYGLSLTDQQSRETLKLADRIDFELDSSGKHLVTRPFNIVANIRGGRISLKGCVFEAGAEDSNFAKFTVNEATLDVEGDFFVARGMALLVHVRGNDWKEDPRFLFGDADLRFRANQIESSTVTVSKDVDLLVSIKNGLFFKEAYAADSGRVNFLELFGPKWGANKAVASIEGCSLNILGSSVKLAGKLAFHDPVAESELDFLLSAKDFSRIMKFIYGINKEAFDKIVAALVTLQEKKVDIYNQSTDSIDLNISLRNSNMRINDRELRDILSSTSG